jgi:RHS repeat-associated protein
VSVTFRNSSDVKTKEVVHKYDAFDRRIAKDVDDDGNGTFDSGERYVYDGSDIVLVFTDAGALTERLLYGPAVDQPLASEDGSGQVRWMLADNQGTVRDVAEYDAGTDTTSIVNHLQYWSFGNITAQTNSSEEPRHTYTGREWDADAELSYYRGRWYDPGVGRFISEDPVGFNGDPTNLARYVGNSPNNFVDPSGLDGLLSNIWDNVFVPFGNGAVNTYVHCMTRSLCPVYCAYEDVQFVASLLDGTVSPAQAGKDLGMDYFDEVSRPVAMPYREALRWYGAIQPPETEMAHLAQDLSARDGRDVVLATGIAAAIATTPTPAAKPVASDTPAQRITQPIGDLRAAGIKDAHHVIQDAAVRHLPGYDTNAAPGVGLPGPSTLRGSPHYNATQVQRLPGGGTYGAERQIGGDALRAAGVDEAKATQAVREADEYFNLLGIDENTITRIPGNRQQ